MDLHTLSNGRLTAKINAAGAELSSLQDAEGREFLWQAGPEWPRHAPLLFPIVGRLKDDVLHHRGKSYPMTQHGFARDSQFTWTERTLQTCALRLEDDAASRAKYPFAFRLDASFALHEDTLVIGYAITNTGKDMLPASIGAHPAFNWPLPGADDKQAHSLVFAQAEPAPIRRLRDGLLLPDARPTPVEGGALALSDSLFVDDAIIIDQLASTSLRYMAPGAPSIDVAWQGFHQLGIWSKPSGAPFLCIEPWMGFASPVDFDGAFSDKPGVMHIGIGETRSFVQRIGVG